MEHAAFDQGLAQQFANSSQGTLLCLGELKAESLYPHGQAGNENLARIWGKIRLLCRFFTTTGKPLTGFRSSFI